MWPKNISENKKCSKKKEKTTNTCLLTFKWDPERTKKTLLVLVLVLFLFSISFFPQFFCNFECFAEWCVNFKPLSDVYVCLIVVYLRSLYSICSFYSWLKPQRFLKDIFHLEKCRVMMEYLFSNLIQEFFQYIQSRICGRKHFRGTKLFYWKETINQVI